MQNMLIVDLSTLITDKVFISQGTGMPMYLNILLLSVTVRVFANLIILLLFITLLDEI